MSSKKCYNNSAFNTRCDQIDVARDSMNNQLEIRGYQAFNETFLDDNGLEICREEPYIDIREEVFHRSVPKCRRSIAESQVRHYDFIHGKRNIYEAQVKSVAVGFHKDRFPSISQNDPSTSRYRYESISSDDRSDISRVLSTPKKSTPLINNSTRESYDTIDALYRRYEEIESANEEYVDYPEDRMGGEFRGGNYLPNRESPLGSSGTIKHPEPNNRTNITPVTTPKKIEMITPKRLQMVTPKKQTTTPKRETPTKLSRRNTIVLAPMIANIEKQQKQSSPLHRSKSSILSSPRRPILVRSPGKYYPTATLISPNSYGGSMFLQQQTHFHRQNSQLGKSMPSLVVPKYHTPVKLESFNHLFDSDIMDPAFDSTRTSNRKPNTAIITPNMRSSIAPLLPNTPPRADASPPPVKSPSNYSKVSWATLPIIHLPTEMLCLFGFILLTAGAATAILCFYILSIGGRRYFLNFGAIAGFASLILGMLSCRTNKWKWLPHRNYLTGYILLGTFSLLNTACLGGIVYAFEVQSFALLDTLGGAVCGVSTLLIAGALIGMITSGCCHRPPPDNRVAHCVTGFTV